MELTLSQHGTKKKRLAPVSLTFRETDPPILLGVSITFSNMLIRGLQTEFPVPLDIPDNGFLLLGEQMEDACGGRYGNDVWRFCPMIDCIESERRGRGRFLALTPFFVWFFAVERLVSCALVYVLSLHQA